MEFEIGYQPLDKDSVLILLTLIFEEAFHLGQRNLTELWQFRTLLSNL